MKTYKGYNKLPYCTTHYPTTKFTAVADTPENKRLAAQTKAQSEVVYRKDRDTQHQFHQIADSRDQQRLQAASNLSLIHI